MTKLVEINHVLDNLDEKTYEKYETLINNMYDKLTLEEKIKIFRFAGRYPQDGDVTTFESELIKKYVLRARPEDDFLMILIRNKQKMFNDLFNKFCEEKCDQKSYLLLEKIIFLFLEYKNEIVINKTHLLDLTKAMHQSFSFVLAAFISKNKTILENTPFSEIFLPRLIVFIERFNDGKKVEEPNLKADEVYNEPNIDLPNTIQEAIFRIEGSSLSADILMFYIFTAPSDIILAYKYSLFPLFLRCASNVFFAIFYERTGDCPAILEYFFAQCSESEKLRILESFTFLKGTHNFKYLTNGIRENCKKRIISDHIKDTLKKSFGINF